MRDIFLITICSIKNNLKSKVLTIVFVCITLMIAAGLALFFCLLLIAPEINKPSPNRIQLEIYLCLIMYTTCIICLGINMNVFAFQSITKEKTRGNIESLLATPLSVKNIWVAKSLAVFIPGMILGEILTLAALLAVNYIYFVPKMGFIYTHWIGLSSFLAIPLVYLCLSLLAHLIGLTGKPANGNIIAQIFLPVVLTLMINLTIRNILDAASWPFTLVNLGLAAIIAIIVIFLQPRITRERIVLSR
jgi:ABC-2 type transport system permease protein